MKEQTFQIRLDQTATHRNNLYGLRTRRNTTILNGNRFKYNDVMREIRHEYKQYKNYQIMKDLAILMS